MAKQEIRRKANIGSSSLILIFIVLCLVTFSVLSLGNAKREDALSSRSADSVQEYYRADAAGEAFLQRSSRVCSSGRGKSEEMLTQMSGDGASDNLR